jgi:hypothetical protein
LFSQISLYFTYIKNFFSLSHLTIDSLALARLSEEKAKTAKDLKLEILIKRQKSGKGQVFVGFKEFIPGARLHPKLEHFISESDYLDLAYGVVSFSVEDGKFLFYPNVDLEWADTPNPKIKSITANKQFTNSNSTWSSDMPVRFIPILEIVNQVDVVSIFASGHKLQIEFADSEISSELEAEISEHLLTYFSDLYPRLDEV